jgi:hypothetical protein
MLLLRAAPLSRSIHVKDIPRTFLGVAHNNSLELPWEVDSHWAAYVYVA